MWKVWLGFAIFWVALLPPWFTAGACTQEFLAAGQLVEGLSGQSATPEALADALRGANLSARVLSPEDCKAARPAFLAQCGNGFVVYGAVPVTHQVCRLYRDSETRFQVYFDSKRRPVRVATEMKPFKSLQWPGSDIVIHWAR